MISTTSSTTRAGPLGHNRDTDWPGLFHNVLVGVDGTAGGRDAIALADVLRGTGGQLTLARVGINQVPVNHNFPATPTGERARALLERERETAEVTAELAGMIAPSVGRGLHQLADDHGADLVVVGSCRRGRVGRVLIGDDARGTVNGASCAVAVAPHGYRQWPPVANTIGIAYDDTDEARGALAVARRLAVRDGRQLSAVTVVSPVSVPVDGWGRLTPAWQIATDTLREAAMQRLRTLEGIDEWRVAIGAAGDELVAFGDDVGLLVVGSRGYGPVRRVLLGSTSLHLTRDARCPLLVIPRPPHANPTQGAA